MGGTRGETYALVVLVSARPRASLVTRLVSRTRAALVTRLVSRSSSTGYLFVGATGVVVMEAKWGRAESASTVAC